MGIHDVFAILGGRDSREQEDHHRYFRESHLVRFGSVVCRPRSVELRFRCPLHILYEEELRSLQGKMPECLYAIVYFEPVICCISQDRCRGDTLSLDHLIGFLLQ